MASPFTPSDAFSYLTSQGYSPVQAAAIAGNIQQESSGNPSALNQGEGAYGLIQWRLDRRKALEDFAKSRGTSPADPYAQLDFIGHEMRGTESRNAAPFLAAQDLPSANSALKRYIRYGDDSEGTRLTNAAGLLGGNFGQPSAPQPAQTSSPLAGILGNAAPQAQGGANYAALAGLLNPRPQPFLQPQMMAPLPRRHIDLSALQAMANGSA
jgi:hypothetical protein